MPLTTSQFAEILGEDEVRAFSWERESDLRRLARPATNLGAGRKRFWELLRHMSSNVERQESICDVGAYPGTALRLIRQMPAGSNLRLAAAGF